MNCNEFELLLADALGDELAEADRSAFDEHLSQCENCRREYEAATGTVKTLQSLRGPQRISHVTFVRQDERLVIHEASSTRAGDSASTSVSASASMKSFRPFSYGVMRYAASVLIAFTAGYGLHAGVMITGSSNQSLTTDPNQKPAIVQGTSPHDTRSDSASPDFQTALVSVHTKNPARSGLAKGMIAMFANKG